MSEPSDCVVCVDIEMITVPLAANWWGSGEFCLTAFVFVLYLA